MRTLVLSLVAAFAVLALGGAGLAQSAAPASSPAASAGAPSPVPSPAAVVHVKDFKFVPDTVTIHPGQTVRFVEDDDTPHTVTASDRTYDSGNLDKGQSWTHAFAKEGTYKYFCAYHTFMTGTVVVK
jgi:plastocyanin